MKAVLIVVWLLFVFGCGKHPAVLEFERLEAIDAKAAAAKVAADAKAISNPSTTRDANLATLEVYNNAVASGDEDKTAMMAAFVRMTNAINNGDKKTFEAQGALYEKYRLRVQRKK